MLSPGQKSSYFEFFLGKGGNWHIFPFDQSNYEEPFLKTKTAEQCWQNVAVYSDEIIDLFSNDSKSWGILAA